MGSLFEASIPYLPAILAVILLLLLTPLVGEVGRRRIVILFALAAIGLMVLAMRTADQTAVLDVYNPFPVGEDMRSTPILIEHVTAPGWQWPALCAAFCGLCALIVFATIRLPVGAPSPVVHCLLGGTAIVLLRLGLEKTAAPVGLVWAAGGSIVLPVICGFAGYYAASRRQSYLGMLRGILVLGVLQRVVIAAIALFLTLNTLGTHLDVNAVSELNTPLGGQRTFGDDALGKWVWAILVPQMVLWVALTVVLGATIGGLGWRIGRR